MFFWSSFKFTIPAHLGQDSNSPIFHKRNNFNYIFHLIANLSLWIKANYPCSVIFPFFIEWNYLDSVEFHFTDNKFEAKFQRHPKVFFHIQFNGSEMEFILNFFHPSVQLMRSYSRTLLKIHKHPKIITNRIKKKFSCHWNANVSHWSK